MLQGSSVTLGTPRPEDSEILFGWINDPEIVRFNASYRPIGHAAHEAWFDGLNKGSSRIFFAIRSPEHLVGSLQLIDIHPVHRTAELIIRIGQETDRGKGYGSDALKVAIAFAWNDLNLQRVWLRVFADNKRAQRAYEKAGFAVEGTMKRAAFVNGAFVDEIIMAVLRSS